MPNGLLSSYDATELERQYNPRSFTPNAEDLMGIPVDLSAVFRNRGGAAAMDGIDPMLDWLVETRPVFTWKPSRRPGGDVYPWRILAGAEQE